MRIDTGQHMRLGQQMKLSPRMIQSMEILQMPAQALEERIEEELASNPTLELREVGADRRELEAEHVQEQRDDKEGERSLDVQDTPTTNNTDDFERLTNFADENRDTWESNISETGETYAPRARSDDGERDGKLDAMANAPARSASLADQLLDQWMMVENPPEVSRAGEYLIGFIDDDGYLRVDDETLQKQAPPGIAPELIQRALARLQRTLEPVGMGARDLRECLLLQIDARAAEKDAPDLTIQRALVADHLKDIEANRIPKIAKSLNVDVEAVKQAIHSLRQFQPHPGRQLIDAAPHAIMPDAIVEFDEEQGRYIARLFDGRMPSVQINPRYLKMARDAAVERRARDFLSNNIRSARWLLDAIAQRHATLLRVINVVIEAQRDFFDLGPQALKPLPMTQVADQLGIHVATVSRAVSEKYIQCPRGIFPLRMFFSGGTETQSGDAMSWTAVQEKLREIIAAEDKANPLNDDELVEKLREKGIEIARRTVAKYRKELQIATARQRRQF
ncbi:MAG: RNA polymerase factor sigma-54 [Planctomycetes bacterium]|nr:RNA polymerase factor sigma-54 [Planctomycetota bacterium]